MALLQINHVRFNADLVAFDKDGTLIEFDRMWIRLTAAWLEHLTTGSHDPALAADLHRTLGYDASRQAILSQSPLAIAPTLQLQTIIASVLYRNGVPWPEAEDRSRAAISWARTQTPLEELIQPAGDVASLLAQIRAAGAQVAVVTTDHRSETEETLRILGIEGLVNAMVCGDDGIPSKPAPDMLLAICERLRTKPAHTVLIGDTEADMLMAQRAGAGLCVAVLTGAGAPDQLAAMADIVISSIDAITVQKEQETG
jgi:HAD superfamily hydrolase (TIGR01549 family)